MTEGATVPPESKRRGRAHYRHFLTIPTRWMDNDSYGHVNNVTYYSYFDTVVNEHLIRVAQFDFRTAPAIGVAVETSCQFLRSLTFPETIDAGMRVEKLGRSSVVYAIGLFRQGDDLAAAVGRFVHVWVERATQRPTPIPDEIRLALAPLFKAAVTGGA